MNSKSASSQATGVSRSKFSELGSALRRAVKLANERIYRRWRQTLLRDVKREEATDSLEYRNLFFFKQTLLTHLNQLIQY